MANRHSGSFVSVAAERAFKSRFMVLTAVIFAMAASISCIQSFDGPDSALDLPEPSLRIGWAEVDITPEEPVILRGIFRSRVSEGVKDPITSTAMALESLDDKGVRTSLVMVSSDLAAISSCISEAVRGHIAEELPEIDPESVILNATHSHTAPHDWIRRRYSEDSEIVENPYGVDLPIMLPADYIAFASRKMADGVIEAWNSRTPSGIAYGLGHAVVGRNRLIAYKDGTSVMHGQTDVGEFSHVEGYEDHSVNIISVYLPGGDLTGLVINIAAPSQLDANLDLISADWWHETRQEIRRRFGNELYILPQCSAAGDQNARPPVEWAAEERMHRLAGRTAREDIGVRIADAVEKVLPLISPEICWNPAVSHRREMLGLPRRRISQEDVDAAIRSGLEHRKRYEKLMEDLEKNPEKRLQPGWFDDIGRAYRSSSTGERMRARFEAQERNPLLQVEVHAIRLGDVGFVTNPFELYLDYGMQIKGRSPAFQTFIVQLAGPGSYLPPQRSIERGAYGSAPSSTEIGPEGGDVLIEWSVEALRGLWKHEDIIIPHIGYSFEVDGDVSKWEGLPYIFLGERSDVASTITRMGAGELWDGPDDLSLRMFFGRDEENLYVFAAVRDDRHFNLQEGSRIWSGDSLQFALDPIKEGIVPFNLGLALARGRVQAYQWAGSDAGLLQKSQYIVVRDDESSKTFYELKIPFESFGFDPAADEKFRFNAVVFDDDDGTGFDYWMQLSPGIAGGWNPESFRIFVPGD